MKIVVIDGQGGNLGKTLVENIKKKAIDCEIYAIGTNSIATSSMLKAGADFAATGENPVVVNSRDADIITGPIGIIATDSLLGEITEKMSTAVTRSSAAKVLIPLNKCEIKIAGTLNKGMTELVSDAVKIIEEICSQS